MKRLFFIALTGLVALAVYATDTDSTNGATTNMPKAPLAGAAASETLVAPMQLLMLEKAGCPWCEQWHNEIGPIYPKTSEGKAAPLRVVRVDHELPKDLKGLRPGRFTPTFILWSKGRELGRLRGYQGEEFFWALIGDMIVDAKAVEVPGAVN